VHRGDRSIQWKVPVLLVKDIKLREVASIPYTNGAAMDIGLRRRIQMGFDMRVA
jgi:hypothetical protein